MTEVIRLAQELLKELGCLPGIKTTFREGWLPDKPEMRYMRDHTASKGTGLETIAPLFSFGPFRRPFLRKPAVTGASVSERGAAERGGQHQACGGRGGGARGPAARPVLVGRLDRLAAGAGSLQLRDSVRLQ